MVQVCALNDAEEDDELHAPVVLDERQAQVHLGEEDDNDEKKSKVWYLDSGANNHMTEERVAFSELDTGVVGTVKFGDGLRVNNHGRNTVIFRCQNGEQRAFTDVYYIPKLRSNIISIGKLNKRGCRVLIDYGVLLIRDKD
jgi:hypothetical protein